MKVPYTKSGTCGDTTFQASRWGSQISYPYRSHIPYDPKSPRQTAVRGIFGLIAARWRTLSEAQRRLWRQAGPTHKTRMRLGNGPMPGYNYFVQVNVMRVNRGLPQIDVPPEYAQEPPEQTTVPELREVPLLRPLPLPSIPEPHPWVSVTALAAARERRLCGPPSG
jgi:hypothetical protein